MRHHRIRPLGKLDVAQGLGALLVVLWLLGEIEVAWLRAIQP